MLKSLIGGGLLLLALWLPQVPSEKPSSVEGGNLCTGYSQARTCDDKPNVDCRSSFPEYSRWWSPKKCDG